MLCTAQGHRRAMLGLAFAPDGRTLCSVGVGFVRFYTRQGRSLKGKSGRITTTAPPIAASTASGLCYTYLCLLAF
jgi:hypothetical protein